MIKVVNYMYVFVINLNKCCKVYVLVFWDIFINRIIECFINMIYNLIDFWIDILYKSKIVGIK